MVPVDRRRAEAAHLLPGARPADPALGLRQPGLRLDQRRQVHPLPLACAIRWTLGRHAALHRPDDGRPGRAAAHARVRAPATSRPTAPSMVYSPLFRDFRPEKRYGGGQANDLFIFDLKTNDAKRSHRQPARRPRPDVDRQHDLLHSDRDGTFNLYAYDVASARSRQLTTQHGLGRPLAEHGPPGPHRLRAERRAADARRQDRQEHADLDHRAGRRAVRSGPSRVSAAGQIEDFELSAQGRTRAVQPPAATSSRRPSRRARRATSPARRARTTSGRAGRRTARRSPSSPTAAAKRSCTWSRQDGTGKPEQLTSGGKAMRYQPEWSPDGKRHRVQRQGRQGAASTRVDDKKLTEIVDAPRGQVARLHVVAEGQLPGLQHERRERLPLDPHLERDRRPAAPGHRRVVQRREPRLGSRTATTSSS